MVVRGGIASLTLATAPDGRQVVLRELLAEHRYNMRMRRKFSYGTRVRVKLSSHPNICASLSRRSLRLLPYEVIEYVPGSNLQDLITKRDPVVRQNRLEILRQCATALSYVHSQGILHLDVKASNFLVDTTGDALRVKLTDFDLSIPQTVRRDPRRSGTLRYMPPEQVISGSVSIMSDMFAFGVMAYCLVTGQSPFPGEDSRQERSRQLSKSYKIIDPLMINPDLTPRLAWVIMRCLEKDPENRFPDMAYLCQELGKGAV